MSPRPQEWRRVALGVTISLVALVAIFSLVDVARFLQALQQANYRYLPLFFAFSLLWLGVRGLLWRTLLQEQAAYRTVFLTLNQGYLLNNLLPFRLGEVGRAFLLARKAQLGFFQVFSTVIIERALDVVFAAGLLMSTLPFVVGVSAAEGVALSLGALMIVGLFVLHLLGRHQSWTRQQLAWLRERVPVLSRLLTEPRVEAFFAGLAALVEGRRLLKTLLLMTLAWAIAVAQFYILLQAFYPQARWLWASFTVSVMALGIALPSSPGAVGVLEMAIMGALAIFSLDASTALAVALTAHLANYLVTGFFGSLALVQDGLTLGGLFRQVRHLSPPSLEDTP